MDSLVTICIHHYGDFGPEPNPKYIGGEVEVINGFDNDLLSFRDLDDFAVKCHYSLSDLVYFKNDGTTFENGVRLLFDDNTAREVVDIHKPLWRRVIDLYIDHYKLDEVIDLPQGDRVSQEANEGNVESDYSDFDDPGYDVETESDESEDESLYDSFGDSDDELKEFRQEKMKFKESLTVNNNKYDVSVSITALSDDSEYAYDELRSDSSSSKDENHRIGYIGPPNTKKRKRNINRIRYGNKDDNIKWEVGMKFSSLAEFRDVVRQYGIKERRGEQFVTNDAKRV